MRSNSSRHFWLVPIAAAALALFGVSKSNGQLNPFTAPPGAINDLNSGPVAPAGGAVALERARGLSTPATTMEDTMNLGAPRPGAGAPPPGGLPGLGGALPAPGAPGAAGVTDAVARIIKPKIKVFSGKRVFDAVSGELLDDAQLSFIDESEKANYYDDGTHGDLTPEDGTFARVDVSRDFLGQSNQRIKEHLVQSIYEAERLTPIDFFGYSLMTTDRVSHPPRNRRWKMVPNAEGVGYHLEEVETETPLVVPRYQDKRQDQDSKIAGQDGWAKVFLDEFRTDKGNLRSSFYPMYVPLPPQPPTIAPPPASSWTPFTNTIGGQGGQGGQAQQQQPQGGGGGGLGGFAR